jgi:hypothetical protein
MPTILELFSSKLIETPNGLSETAEKGVDSQKKTYKINNVATDGTDISGPIRAFNTLQLKDGKTARFTTDINNRPFSKIDTSNIFLKNTSFPLVNKLKSGRFAKKDNETFTEEELTGLRPLQLLSQPVLYGTDILKITAREARSTRKMKFGTYDYETAVQVAKTIQPTIYTPTGLFLNDEFRRGKVIQKPGLFSKLRGTPEQLLLQLALHPIDALKKLTSPKGITLNKTNTTSNTQIVVRNNNISKNGVPVELLRYSTLSFDTDNLTYTKQLKKDSNVELKDRNDLAGKLNEILNGKTITDENDPNFATQGYDKKILTGNGFIYDFDKGTLYKNEKSKYIGKVKLPSGGETSYKYTGAYGNGTDARGDKVFEKDLNIETYRGMQRGSDFLNSKTILDGSTDLDTTFNNKDFATLKFESVATGKRARFRATISGLTETFTPSWESNKFVGNPFNFYTYNSIERSVTFTFKVFSLNYDEHRTAWSRLSFLSSLVYPQSYINKNYVTPPFIKFTIGDMYKNKAAFIESLTYTVDDNTTWETGLKQSLVTDPTTKQTELITSERLVTSTDATIKSEGSYILPKIIEVAMTLKLVETPKEIYDLTNDKGVKVLYGFTDKEITDNVLSPIKDAPFGDVKTLENGSVQKVAGVENNSQNTAQTTNSGVSTNTSTGGTAIGTSTNSTTSGASSGGTALGTSNGSTTPKTPVTDPTDPFQQPGTSVTRTPI